MTRVWTVMLAVFVAGAVAGADEAVRAKLAAELVDLMGIEKGIENSFDAAKKAAVAQLTAQGKTEAIAAIEKDLAWDAIKGEYVSLCVATFTESEIKGMIEFYKSPVGRVLADKTPGLMKALGEIMQRKKAELSKKVLAALQPANAPAAAKPTGQ